MKKIKKHQGLFFLTIFLSLLCACSQEDLSVPDFDNQSSDAGKETTEITLEEARAELISLLADIDRQTTRSGGFGHRIISNSYVAHFGATVTRSDSVDGELPFYVFNFENEEGFAIMSSDNRLPSLIALASDGSLNEGDSIDNPGFEIFMEALGDWIITPPGTGGPGSGLLPPGDPKPGVDDSLPTYYHYSAWQNTVYPQGGLCFVKWDQSYPYNNNCPIKNGSSTVTGCVATAVAQLMSIYKYPTSYKGKSYDWDAMTAYKYGHLCSRSAMIDMAHLMANLGTKENLDMEYGIEASAAYPNNIPRTLKNFGYSKSGSLVTYSTTSIVNELKSGFPVLVGGYTKENVGHRWLAHGLLVRSRERQTRSTINHYILSTDTVYEYYILNNWGWSGYADGYFLSEVFDLYRGQSFGDNYPDIDNDEKQKRSYYFEQNLNMVTGIRK